MKEVTVPIKGMHCRSCEITLTDKLEQLPNVDKADVSLKTKTATIHARILPPKSAIKHAISSAGYEIGYDKKPFFSKNISDYKDVAIGIVIVAILAIVVTRLDIAGINTGSVASGGGLAALFVGLAAGISTCMALVGGLVLGLSAKHAEMHPSATVMQKFRPHIFFNLSRIIAFFILGGVIGAAGSVFQLQGGLLGGLTMLVGVVMLILGFQLTGLFPRLSAGGITLPSGIATRLGIKSRNKQDYSHKNAVILGALSFILPCGFTQAMQLYAISTGSFTQGAIIMGMFAIGTMPGLLSVGGLTSAVEGSFAKRFFKIAGVAVVAMAILNISNGYNLSGWHNSVTGIFAASETEEYQSSDDITAGDSKLSATYTLKSGMLPREFVVKANQSYTLEVLAREDGVGCMSTILIPGLNNDVQTLREGKTNKLAFKAPRPGTYQITCAMGIPHGKIKVLR
jgi:sulfite exporter TauE/SafE/copper chaperone CopZ